MTQVHEQRPASLVETAKRPPSLEEGDRGAPPPPAPAERTRRRPRLPAWIKTAKAAMAIGLALVLVGGFVANTAQTNGGTVRIEKVSFPTSTGQMMTGLLYVPKTATAKTPAPGVVAIEGYINTVDTMDGFSIEMARRGAVVLDANQTGQGTSTPPSFLDGFGGPPALAYLSSLPIVQKGNIGLIGHSMGGWASVIAAAGNPTAYRSIVLVSSSVSTPVYEPVPGTPTFPKNVAVVEASGSEFARLMWDVPKGSDFPKSKRMQAMFGTTSPIQTGKVYGSVANGTGRVLYVESNTHPGLTFDPSAIEHSVSWMQQTLTGVSTRSASDQIWLADEIGTFLALIGVVVLLFGAGGTLLRTNFFKSVVREQPVNRSLKGLPWWLGALILVLVGPVAFFWFQLYGQHQFKVGAIFPEQITTGIMVWAVGGAIIAGLLYTAWSYSTRAAPRTVLASSGIAEPEGKPVDWMNIGKSFLLALSVVAITYAAVFFFDWAWTSDVRIWIFNIRAVDTLHLPVILSYIGPFFVYFFVLSTVLFGQLRPRVDSMAKFMGIYTALLVIGYVGLLAIEYGVLGVTGQLATSSQPLLTIVGYQFVPIFAIVGPVLSYFFWKTGRIYTGAFISAMLITSIVVMNTALQAVPW